jgi:hypothetical protein
MEISMAKHLIFVSCGQLTEAEKTLGVLIKTVIDGTPGFESYFAETVQDVEALGRHVLDGIRRCVGAVVVLQDRGVVMRSDGIEWGHRSSVWVNQEVAILAYRQFFEEKKIPILAFAEAEVKLEGAMTSLIVNPRPLVSPQDVAGNVKTWLGETQFSGTSDDAFIIKWNQLSDDARKVVAGLLEEGGCNVKETAVRHAAMRLFGMQRELASQAVRESKLQFMATDLVKLIHDINSGDELSVHPTWEFQLRRQTARWLEEQRSKQ